MKKKKPKRTCEALVLCHSWRTLEELCLAKIFWYFGCYDSFIHTLICPSLLVLGMFSFASFAVHSAVCFVAQHILSDLLLACTFSVCNIPIVQRVVIIEPAGGTMKALASYTWSLKVWLKLQLDEELLVSAVFCLLCLRRAKDEWLENKIEVCCGHQPIFYV